MSYSSVEAVISYTGAKPETLGIDDPTAFRARIQDYLDQATDFIRRDRSRRFEDEPEGVPLAIDNIATRIAANLVRMAEKQRTSSVTTFDASTDSLRLSEPSIFTPAIREDLWRIPRGMTMRWTVVGPEDDS